MRALTRDDNIYTTQKVSQKPVSYMAPGIHQINTMYWETLVLSMLKLDLLRTAVKIPYQERNLTVRNIIMLLLVV